MGLGFVKNTYDYFLTLSNTCIPVYMTLNVIIVTVTWKFIILTAGLISNQILQNDSATVDKVLVTVKRSDGRTVQKEIKMKCPNLSQKFTISIRKKHLM